MLELDGGLADLLLVQHWFVRRWAGKIGQILRFDGLASNARAGPFGLLCIYLTLGFLLCLQGRVGLHGLAIERLIGITAPGETLDAPAGEPGQLRGHGVFQVVAKAQGFAGGWS
ncbi:hypothetical protein D3C86_1498090 [compost metagenome]